MGRHCVLRHVKNSGDFARWDSAEFVHDDDVNTWNAMSYLKIFAVTCAAMMPRREMIEVGRLLNPGRPAIGRLAALVSPGIETATAAPAKGYVLRPKEIDVDPMSTSLLQREICSSRTVASTI